MTHEEEVRVVLQRFGEEVGDGLRQGALGGDDGQQMPVQLPAHRQQEVPCMHEDKVGGGGWGLEGVGGGG